MIEECITYAVLREHASISVIEDCNTTQERMPSILERPIAFCFKLLFGTLKAFRLMNGMQKCSRFLGSSR